VAKRNEFDKEEAGSLVENNTITFVALPVMEQAFETALRSAVTFDTDWQIQATRAVLLVACYNIIKIFTLWRRDQNGETAIRKAGAWLWVKLFGE
jgi:hypothetical protein